MSLTSLTDGASLFYTSVKEEKNCDLLHQYLLHRIYGFPFNMPAFVVEKDKYIRKHYLIDKQQQIGQELDRNVVPAGWDNDKKIAILHENLQNIKPTDAYEDVIAKPIVRKPVQRDAEVTVEDVQLFLMKQQSHLSKAPSPGAAGESPVRTGSQTPKTATIGKAASSPTPTTKLVVVSELRLRSIKNWRTSETLIASMVLPHCRGARRARENDKDHGKNYKKSPFRCQPKWTNRLLIGSFLTMYVMVSFLKRREKTATLCIIMIWGIFAACATKCESFKRSNQHSGCKSKDPVDTKCIFESNNFCGHVEPKTDDISGSKQAKQDASKHHKGTCPSACLLGHASLQEPLRHFVNC
ncbi:DC1L2-like protein [Mya arenaria]|uniref:Dynein light intermediate chain n=1 Tax=Mya arenaria TaxID=6604 RepID=A0ABY7ET66_MYAAR|nr:DC1L2-like protein [Mya arenaria]